MITLYTPYAATMGNALTIPESDRVSKWPREKAPNHDPTHGLTGYFSIKPTA